MLVLLSFLLIALKVNRSLYFYQLKEYRFDRLIDFLRNEKGFWHFFSPLAIIAYLSFIVAQLSGNLLFTIIGILWLLLDLICLYSCQARLRFRPTLKALALFLTTIGLSLGLLITDILSLPLTFICAPLILLAVVVITKPITHLLKELIIQKARQHILKHPHLTIIVVTGSYGKTSVKHFLWQVLSQHFKVCVTPKNINTDIGIAKLILNKLKSEDQILIVEAGAYCRGEINNIVKMFDIDYAVLTAVSNQHLALFKTLDNIKQAKFEIANTLKPKAKLFLNYQSEPLRTPPKSIPASQIVYYGNSKFNYKKLTTSPQGLTFTVNDQQYHTPLQAPHNALNLLPVIAIAQDLKIPNNLIQKAISKLTNPDNTLLVKTSSKSQVILDDSYNSNTVGFHTAISIAATYSETPKILITLGIPELGSLSKQEHCTIASQAFQVFDIIIITKPYVYDYFMAMKPDSFNQLYLAEKPNDIIAILEELPTHSLILLENRVNSAVLNYLQI